MTDGRRLGARQLLYDVGRNLFGKVADDKAHGLHLSQELA